MVGGGTDTTDTRYNAKYKHSVILDVLSVLFFYISEVNFIVLCISVSFLPHEI